MFGSQIFDAVMGQSDSVRKKPAPDGPLKIAEQFGIKPEECMYLGDSEQTCKLEKQPECTR